MLRGKKILITAGPTWVPIDQVRVISNISSGEMGLLLASRASSLGMKVDLLLGPVGSVDISGSISVSRFKYFDELLGLIKTKLKEKKYDYILHAAAVSDYLTRPVSGKISSQQKKLILSLDRAPKIIETIRRLAPRALLVMFKLETNVTDPILLKRALEAMKDTKADLAVANTFVSGRYRSFILGAKDILAKPRSKKELSVDLFEVMKEMANSPLA